MESWAYSKCTLYYINFIPDPAQNDKCYEMKFVPREKWNARPPVGRDPMLLPVSHVIIMHTHDVCTNLYMCSRGLQMIQDRHMDEYGKFYLHLPICLSA